MSRTETFHRKVAVAAIVIGTVGEMSVPVGIVSRQWVDAADCCSSFLSFLPKESPIYSPVSCVQFLVPGIESPLWTLMPTRPQLP